MKKIKGIIIKVLSYCIMALDDNLIIKEISSDKNIINAHSKLKGVTFMQRKFESINNQHS